MYYVINVALNGKHFFATAEHSLRDESSAKRAYEDFLKRFPKDEGFEVSVTHWRLEGPDVEGAPWKRR